MAAGNPTHKPSAFQPRQHCIRRSLPFWAASDPNHGFGCASVDAATKRTRWAVASARGFLAIVSIVGVLNAATAFAQEPPVQEVTTQAAPSIEKTSTLDFIAAPFP